MQDMVWDTTGHRLAIIFTRKAVLNIKCCKVIIPVCVCVCVADSEGCELVALFRTHVGHFLLDLLPV